MWQIIFIHTHGRRISYLLLSEQIMACCKTKVVVTLCKILTRHKFSMDNCWVFLTGNPLSTNSSRTVSFWPVYVFVCIGASLQTCSIYSPSIFLCTRTVCWSFVPVNNTWRVNLNLKNYSICFVTLFIFKSCNMHAIFFPHNPKTFELFILLLFT